MSSMGFIKALESMSNGIPVSNPVDYPECFFFFAKFPKMKKFKNRVSGKTVALNFRMPYNAGETQLCMYNTRTKVLKRNIKFGGKEMSDKENWQQSLLNWDTCWELLKLGFEMKRLSWVKKQWECKSISYIPGCKFADEKAELRVHFRKNIDRFDISKREYKTLRLPIKPNDPTGFAEAHDWIPCLCHTSVVALY